MVGEPSGVEVLGLLWEFGPGQNVEHFARHDVTPEDVFSILTGSPMVFRNLPGRTATHVLIGPDTRGRVLYIAILETAEPGIWKSISGWENRQARSIYYGRA